MYLNTCLEEYSLRYKTHISHAVAQKMLSLLARPEYYDENVDIFASHSAVGKTDVENFALVSFFLIDILRGCCRLDRGIP